MKRAIDTIVHDQAAGPVPAGTAAPPEAKAAGAAVETVQAVDPAAPPVTPEPPAAAPSTTSKRRTRGEE